MRLWEASLAAAGAAARFVSRINTQNRFNLGEIPRFPVHYTITLPYPSDLKRKGAMSDDISIKYHDISITRMRHTSAEPSAQLASEFDLEVEQVNSMTAGTASIQMDLAFVGGEGEWTKDLNCVLLVPLPVATVGRISSGRK